MHGVENVLVHDMDFKPVLFPERGHPVDEVVERTDKFLDVADHDHGEILIEHGLRNIENIEINESFSEESRNVRCKDKSSPIREKSAFSLTKGEECV